MLNQKRVLAAVAALLVLILLAGCTGSKSAEETLQDALKKSSQIDSYSMKGSLQISDLKLPESADDGGYTSMASSFLSNAELSWTGGYRKDPMLAEINLQVAIKGDLAMTVTVPILMNKEKLWVKVPNIPMLGLPAEIVGKYIEVDLKKLAEQQGEDLQSLDIGTTQKLVNDVSAIVFKHIDEDTYLKDVSAKDAGITADGVDKVVQTHVTKDQVEPLIQTVVNDIAPEVIDLLSKNEEYRKLLKIEQSDLDEAKKSLAESKDNDISKDLEEFKKSVQTLDILSNIGIDGKGYASYTDAKIAFAGSEEGQSASGTIKVVQELTDINGDVKLSGEPKAEDVLTEDQLSQLGLPGLGGGSL
ncbi:hypothetical protein SAMN05216312_11698 [Cohnella sp. OV330]|uniref:hypothetical protein n=1 Tax=Cohnella sp. OV330 TaxID=1855288 RepID=UPI0008F227B6|nr:hypothetical protein [Cohnella sp. OV330]SFB60204.1 hypothetical protein SAMN05216312_11698 [Cohnella sp. OV330]